MIWGYPYFRKHPYTCIFVLVENPCVQTSYYANAEMKRVQIPDVAVVAWRFWTTNRKIRPFIVEFSEIKLEKKGWFTTMWEYLGEFSPSSQNHVWCTTSLREVVAVQKWHLSRYDPAKNTVSLDLILFLRWYQVISYYSGQMTKQ